MLNLNAQPTEAVSDSPLLDVVGVWKTIQGEGPFSGVPAVFIRTAGCNLMCPFCDTDYTSTRGPATITSLRHKVRELMPGDWPDPLVVITGGEPFRQPVALTELVLGLHAEGYEVQIETNGTLFAKDFPYELTTVVCSPKTKVRPEMMDQIDAFKYILDSRKVHPDDGLPMGSLGYECEVQRPPTDWLHRGQQVYVQPLDDQDPVLNQQHMKAAVQSCLTYGYRLGIQIHKLVGVE